MKYALDRTSAFKRDYKRVQRRHLPISKLQEVVAKLANGEPLSTANRDHALTGDWANHRECHITSDWLLIYQVKENVLVLELTRTGSHFDLY